MPRITVVERRARLWRRHFLSPESPATSVEELAGGLVGLHATDPATVFLSVRARLRDPAPEHVERALYERRSLLRMIGMRRTMFVVPLELAAVVHAACTADIADAQRRRYARLIEDGGIARDGEAWLERAGREVLRALEALGEASGAELSREVPLLREKVAFGEGTKWAGTAGMTTWVLFLLAAQGSVVRGRPRGTWTGSQWRWTPAAAWLPSPLPRLDPAAARVELVRRWLAAFGPGTFTDLRWWTGLSVRTLRAALEAIGPTEVELDGGTGLVLPGDDGPTPVPAPSVAFLPALDTTTMGWKERDWYLGPHAALLFDRNGNAGPTIWWDGRVVGGWVQRRDGEVAHRLLEEVGADARAAVEAEAERLGRWLGDVRVTPRFPTPLQRELAS